MKRLLIFSFFLIAFTANAQTNTLVPPLDLSPMDMSYFPVNYCILKLQNKVADQPVMRIVYSRPQKNGRKIFGGLLDYGEVWRAGANEATEIEFFRDVKVNNQKIKKGRYTIYAIPYQDKWTVIINKDTDTWGAFKYNSTKDVVRVNVPVIKNDETEDFTIVFSKNNSGADMNMLWDDVKVSVPINF